MNILIIGAGGREHAIGWKLKQSSHVNTIYFAPGNGGTAQIGKNIELTKIGDVVAFVKKNNIGLTVVGPEVPLADGIVDTFQSHGMRIFGPSKMAARLETSKAWAVEFMNRHNIPCPESYIFSDVEKAKEHISKSTWSNFVIKADGLAAGKGVVLALSKIEATKAVERMMVSKAFGDAGCKVLIQEKLIGYEVSIIAFADGKTAIKMAPSQDHKRAYDGDLGPNTGGMGAYAPVEKVDKTILSDIDEKILKPLMAGMREEGYPYVGAIYPGIMVTKDGPKVLEFNVRFGDPETQPQMMLLESDLLEILEACIDGTLTSERVQFKSGATICVVLASRGYPGSYETGAIIHGLDLITDPDIQVFHAGTKKVGDDIVTDGGRVLAVTSYGRTLQEARNKVYSAIGTNGVHFDEMEFRSDIAWQGLKNETNKK